MKGALRIVVAVGGAVQAAVAVLAVPALGLVGLLLRPAVDLVSSLSLACSIERKKKLLSYYIAHPQEKIYTYRFLITHNAFL